MKIKIYLYLITSLLFFSCSPKAFYQVYKVEPVKESLTNNEKMYYEDDNCKISYNMWSNGGNIGFRFYNKTDNDIFIYLNESYFILNDFAYDYYKNRTYTRTEGTSSSASSMSSASIAVTGINIYNNIQTNQVQGSNSVSLNSSIGYSVSIKEDSIICIPARTSKIISEYSINNYFINSCKILKYPTRNKVDKETFTFEKSPIKFSNRITYKINDNKQQIENSFYISSIANIPKIDFYDYKYDVKCGKKLLTKSKYFTYYKINQFYIKYW